MAKSNAAHSRVSKPGTARSRPTTTKSRPATGKSRPKTRATSTAYGYLGNEILCAVSESRGLNPSVGLTFINLTTCEAVLCQFADTQTYARTCHKLRVFEPSEIVFASGPSESKMIAILKENMESENRACTFQDIDRRYFSEQAGKADIKHLAFPGELEALELSLASSYFATCSFAAALKYLEHGLELTFAPQTLRIRYESSEGAMMIDVSTIANLELVQNLQNSKSKHSLFGQLNHGSTKMGTRLLKNNILQPSTDKVKLERRWEAVTELTTREDLFFALRNSLKQLPDTDRALACIVLVPKQLDEDYMIQSVNNVLMLTSFINAIAPIHQALTGVLTDELKDIRELCEPHHYSQIQELINYAISPDVFYSQNALDLTNHRVFAIRSGTNAFIDVARQHYNELIQDAANITDRLQDEHSIPLDLKHEAARDFYLRIKSTDVDSTRPLPDVFINIVKKGKKFIECQSLELVKNNQRILQCHNEILAMADESIQNLINELRTHIHPLFKISEGLGLLDLLVTHAINTSNSNNSDATYIRPEITPGTMAFKSASHPMLVRIAKEKHVPNDIYATTIGKRFQIITGCNMSGKSTYIRSVALLTIMAQIGSFVPGHFASIPIVDQLLARVASDDCIEANVSTFASEMREIAFILRNVSPKSLVIIDELGRGTSTRDGLSIAIAISEALLQSKAMTFLVTHFRELPRILNERTGVYNMHMNVDIVPDFSTIRMRYKIAEGQEEQKYYGLAIAQVVDFPAAVMEVAVAGSKKLNESLIDDEEDDATLIAVARQRKLLIGTRETLTQARASNLDAKDLIEHLKELQRSFLLEMMNIEADLKGRSVLDDYFTTDDPPASRHSTPCLVSDGPNSEHDTSELSIDSDNPLFMPMPTETTECKETLTKDTTWLQDNSDEFDAPICIDSEDSNPMRP